MYNIDVLLTNKIRAAHSGETPRTVARDLFEGVLEIPCQSDKIQISRIDNGRTI